MKKIALLLAALTLFVVSLGTDTLMTGTRVTTVSGHPFVTYGVQTFVAATDTFHTNTFAFDLPEGDNALDTVLCWLNVYVQSVNGDSTVMGLRLLTSSDGTNWKYTTIGTDGTGFVSTATTSYTVYTVCIGTQYSGAIGYQPYNRFMVVGQNGNLAGTKFKLDKIEPR